MKRARLLIAVIGGLAAQAPRSVWDGVFTEDQAKRGAELYTEHCETCHGSELTGGESAPPLTGDTFLSNWNGSTVGDLFDRVRKTMPQDSPGKLSRQENADILAFLLGYNKFPVGKTELATDADALKQIKLAPK
jgi:S-disulfanyl-L-cysteine oxidoreductase SoxD